MLANLLEGLWELGWPTRTALAAHALALASCITTWVIARSSRATAEARSGNAFACVSCVAIAWMNLATAQYSNARGLELACQLRDATAQPLLSKWLSGVIYTSVFSQLSIAAFAIAGVVLAFVFRSRSAGPAADAIGVGIRAAIPLLITLLVTFFVVMGANSFALHGFADTAFSPPSEKHGVLDQAARAVTQTLGLARIVLGAGLIITVPSGLWAARRMHQLGISAGKPQLRMANLLAAMGVLALVATQVAHAHGAAALVRH